MNRKKILILVMVLLGVQTTVFASCDDLSDPQQVIACKQQEAQEMGAIVHLNLNNIYLCDQFKNPDGTPDQHRQADCFNLKDEFDSLKQKALARNTCINNPSSCPQSEPPTTTEIKNDAEEYILDQFYNASFFFTKTNFSNDSCSNLSVIDSNFTCSITSECEVKVDNNWNLSCGKKGFLGINDNGRDDRSVFTENHCKSNYTDPEATGFDPTWNKNNIWASIRMPDGRKITEAGGRDVYKQSLEKLENACKNDDLCQWSGGGSDPDTKCHGRSGQGTEDDIALQQQINNKKTECEKLNADSLWGLNQASTTKDREEAKLKRDEQCYRTEGCTMKQMPNPTDPTASDVLCTVDEGKLRGGQEGFQLSEFTAFDSYGGPVFSGPGLRAGARIAKTKLDNTISKERSLPNLILGWMRMAFSVIPLIAVVAIIYAGFLYVTDFGEGSNKEKAQKIIQYVVIGILVIFGSYGLVNTLMKARFGNQLDAIVYEQSHEAKNFASLKTLS